jgi:hypothetical protein
LIMSSWPKVMGSKDPGNMAFLIFSFFHFFKFEV